LRIVERNRNEKTKGYRFENNEDKYEEQNQQTESGRKRVRRSGSGWKWWAEGREHAGGADRLDPRALRRWVPAGPHGVGLMDGPSEAGGSAASRKLCEPPDLDHAVTVNQYLTESVTSSIGITYSLLSFVLSSNGTLE